MPENVLPNRPYLWHTIPDRPNEEVLRAFLHCFTSHSGQIVLDRLVWSTLLASPEDMRAVGKQDLVREIIDCIQKGLALQRQQIGGTRG